MKKLLQREKKFLIFCLCVLALAPLGYGLCALARRFPEATERIYSQGIYPIFAAPLSRLTGLLPVSVSELALIIFPILLVVQLVRLIRRRTNWLRCLSGLLAAASGLYALFSFGWAVNYGRLPYAQIASLPVEASSVGELERLCLRLSADASSLRAQLTDSEEAYTPPETVRQTLSQVPQAYLTASYSYPWLSGGYAAPKAALSSLPLAYLNIAGIYSPFTFEAHVNSRESPLLLPATACHEAAHLRGFAREDEANFISYAVCVSSGNTRFAYSGTLLALIHAGNALYSADMGAYSRLYDSYTEGLLNDLKAYNANWEPYKGKAAEVQEQVNDRYLKFNGQSEGVRSYGRMVDLLLAEQRAMERS